MTRPPSGVKRPQTASTSASGASFVRGVIEDIVGNVATVRLSTGNQIVHVRTDLLRAKGAAPQIGENWLLDQPYAAGWMFAVPVGYGGLNAAPEWTAATLLGAWTNYSAPGPWTAGSGLYSPAGYLKDDAGVVWLRGAVAGGTVTASDAAGPIAADILQLPVGYRIGPDGQRLFPTYGSAAGAVLVMPDGYVRAYAGSATRFSLDGVSFLAEQ